MITKKFCPRCKSEDIDLVAGGVTGSFICGNCGYSGSIFPEKPIISSEQKMKKEKKYDTKAS